MAMNLRTLLPLLALTALLAPPAHAQSVVETATSVILNPPSAPIPPFGSTGVIEVRVRYTVAVSVPTLAPTQVRLHVTEAPSWAVFTVTPSTLSFHPPVVAPPGASMEAVARVLVSTTPDAPAWVPATITLAAVAMPNGPYAASEGRDSVPVIADAFLETHLAADPVSLQVPRGGSLLVPVTATNFGNTNVRLKFTIAQRPAGAQIGAIFTEPALESRQLGGRQLSVTMPITLAAGSGFEGGDLIVRVETRPAIAPDWAGGPKVSEIQLHFEPGPAVGVVAQAADISTSKESVPLWFGLVGAGAGGVFAWRRKRAAAGEGPTASE